MTFVGKVLIVVNVVLTVCVAAFAGGVFAFQDSWQVKYKKADSDLTEQKIRLDKEAKALEDKLNDMVKERTKFKNSSDKFEAASTGLRTDVADLEATKRSDKAAVKLGVRVNGLLDNDNKIKNRQLVQLRNFLEENQTKTDALRAANSQLEDAVHGLQVERTQIDRKYMALLQREAKYKQILTENGIVYDLREIFVGVPQPVPASGIVLDTLTSVRSRETLVLLSVGRDDDVLAGQVFLVYRLLGKGTYLGKIKVTHVFADTAVGKLVVKTKNGKVQKGDHVSAKLIK